MLNTESPCSRAGWKEEVKRWASENTMNGGKRKAIRGLTTFGKSYGFQRNSGNGSLKSTKELSPQKKPLRNKKKKQRRSKKSIRGQGKKRIPSHNLAPPEPCSGPRSRPTKKEERKLHQEHDTDHGETDDNKRKKNASHRPPGPTGKNQKHHPNTQAGSHKEEQQKTPTHA